MARKKDMIAAIALLAAMLSVSGCTASATAPYDASEYLEVSAASSGQKDRPSTNINDIAKLGSLVGNWSLECTYDDSRVDIDSDENPYDLDWRYGPAPDKGLSASETLEFIEDEAWDDLWESYVDFCNWDLVFDPDFYMETFPILAALYDYDEDALLRHYQTAGIHEGRQANEDFCPAAYMANCRPYLQIKLKNNPECYVIYYMTHSKAESKVDTSNKDGEYPVWLNVEMSYAQSRELDMINKYREDAGSDPVKPHPELMATANLRCRIDAIGQYAAHDWLDTKEHKEKRYRYVLGVKYWDENTIKKTTKNGTVISTPYLNYYNSKPHYKAMVDPAQEYAGTSNFYYSPDWGKLVHFQIYVPSCPNPGSNEMP